MTSQTIGERAPPLTLPDLDGARRSLASFAAGRSGAVVVFWSGMCSHCQRYDRYLGQLPARHPIALVAVASRQNETVEDLRRAVRERGLRFPILLDRDRRAARAWLVEQTPRVFLLDPAGAIRYRGAIDNFKYPDDPEHAPYLETAIADLLAGRPIARPETPSFGCPIESVYYTLPNPLSSRP